MAEAVAVEAEEWEEGAAAQAAAAQAAAAQAAAAGQAAPARPAAAETPLAKTGVSSIPAEAAAEAGGAGEGVEDRLNAVLSKL